MKGLLVFALVAGCSLARPDIGLKLRELSHQIPSAIYGYPDGKYLPPAGLANLDNSQEQSHKIQKSLNSKVDHGDGTLKTFSAVDSSFHSTHEHSSHSSQKSQVSTGVRKYFFDAPEDFPAPLIRIKQQQTENQKNHRVVFIRAPSYQAPRIEIPSILQEKEEKTQIFVLVKKPEEVQHLQIPSFAPKTPTRPEVFFIKYKTQKEAQDKIQQIQNGGSSEGIKSTELESGANLVKTIRDEIKQIQNGGSSEGIKSAGLGSDAYSVKTIREETEQIQSGGSTEGIKSTELGSDANLVKTSVDETYIGNAITGPEQVSKTGFENHSVSGDDRGYEYSTPEITGASHLVQRSSAFEKK